MRLRSRHQQRRAIARGVLCAMVILALGCARRSQEEHAHDASHPDPSGDETVQRGPEGGRLFTGHGIQLELEIVEEGIPPEFRAYLYDDHGRRLPPQDARIAVVLDRLGGRRDSLPFRAETDFSRSQRSVEEPHSFAARVLLEWRGQRQEWSYEQVEGRVALHPEAVTTGDIRIGTAGPRLIEVRVEAPGEVRLNAERVVQVRPRFPGIVQNLRGELGDDVRPGDLLAAVHSNESLTEYSVFAPIRVLSRSRLKRSVALLPT